MIRHKKEIKKIFLTGILIILIIISNFPKFNDIYSHSVDINYQNPIYNEKNEIPNISAINQINESISGTGVDQTVRVFASDESNLTNQENFFEIPPPDSNTNLSHGDFYFNFYNNFTTDYVIEDDNALYPDSAYYESYQYETSTSYIEVHDGIEAPNNGYDDLINDNIPEFNISSSGGLINFTIATEFDPDGTNPDFTQIDFVRENIIGFLLNFSCNVTKDSNVTIYMKDFYDTGDFLNVTTTFEINSSLRNQDIDLVLINENLKFINTSGWCLIRFVFESLDSSDFNLTIFDLENNENEFNIYSLLVMELPISNQKHIALEFDLKGTSTTINGFYVWIRTLNLTKAKNAKLTISLYYANDTMGRTPTNLNWAGTTNIEPNLTTGLIDSKNWTYNDYHGDKLFYFNFDSSKTSDLKRYNYFIVIKSNQSYEYVHSLVCLPLGEYGDGEGVWDHLTLKSDNGGTNWILATWDEEPNIEQLDVSQFKLNITRGYMPSDFKVGGINTLKIQNNTINNVTDLLEDITGQNALNRDVPVLTWGFGRWNHYFTPSLGIYITKFRVILTWNSTATGIKGFKFDVNYTVEAFRTDTITSFYSAKYNKLPEWAFNYSLDLLSDPIFDEWNFTQFWYLYPSYFDAQDITIPNSYQRYNDTNREFSFNELPNYEKFIVNKSIIDPLDKSEYTGTYSLNLTSPNAINDDTFMHSYINFKGILWETRGFMYGDNISVSLDIQDHNGFAPSTGRANVTLFYPNGTKVPDALYNPLYSENGEPNNDNTKLIYRFNNDTILEFIKSIPLATDLSENDHYSLGFFWTNDSIVGCMKIEIYMFIYDINLSACVFIPEDNINNLQGRVYYNFLRDYSLLIASINETTGDYEPNFYPVDNSLTQNEGTFTYRDKIRNYVVYMKEFLQNETILNPEEIMKIKVQIQNLDLFFDLDVKIDVKLVSLANEEWIIAENSSITKKIGKYNPGHDDTEDFVVELTIPEFDPSELVWRGVNAPIRQGGAKTIVDVYIENNYAGSYICNNYSLLINDTDNKFEGYVIALKYSEGLSATTILEKFERDECVYQPKKTTFMANIYDKYYVSFFNQYIKEFDNLKLNSKFDNILINPENPLYGEFFNLSAVLSTEFGVPIPNKEVTLQYYKNGEWVNYSNPKYTDINGSINFEVKSLELEYDTSLVMRLNWKGETYILNNSQEILVNIINQLNIISISSNDDESIVYRNEKAAITFELKNKGNSILRITDIEIDIEDESLDYDIRGQNDIILNWFAPGKDTEIIVEIDISDTDFDELNIEITIIAINILSNEILVVRNEATVEVVDENINDVFIKPVFVIEDLDGNPIFVIQVYMIFVILLFALIFVITMFYVKKTKKKMEIIAKEPTVTKPRRGRYVKITELEPEKVKKIEEPPLEAEEIELEEIKEVKTTDLDTLIEEEIAKKEEKPKKKKKKLPKRVKKPSKKPKKVSPEPISTKKIEKTKKIKKKKVKKEPKKVDLKRVKKKKKTDLDDLLKEKGLDKSK
ncbi:MAG: hypothetical protein ACFFAH_07410 [Promethearchaeota archaeon]